MKLPYDICRVENIHTAYLTICGGKLELSGCFEANENSIITPIMNNESDGKIFINVRTFSLVGKVKGMEVGRLQMRRAGRG